MSSRLKGVEMVGIAPTSKSVNLKILLTRLEMFFMPMQIGRVRSKVRKHSKNLSIYLCKFDSSCAKIRIWNEPRKYDTTTDLRDIDQRVAQAFITRETVQKTA